MQPAASIHERVLKYASLPVSELYAKRRLPAGGLDDAAAAHSRQLYGANVLIRRRADTILYRLRRSFINPFTTILFIIALIAFITDYLLGTASGRISTVPVILAMLVISGAIRFVQELRSRHVLDYLTRLTDARIDVLRSGSWQKLPISQIVVGDRVRFGAGDLVPADLRISGASDLFISQAALTGESAILEKSVQPVHSKHISGNTAFTALTSIAFMGSTVIGGSGEGIVLAVGRDTAYGEIASHAEANESSFERGAGQIAWVLIRFMAVLVPVVFIACALTKGDWVTSFLFALSVAVGLTPEMLPMVVTACLTRGSAAMENRDTIVKNVNSMQAFGSMDILCVDKTGTLTGDKIQLEYYLDILGNESQLTLEYAYLNSLYHSGVPNHLDAAILECRQMPGCRSQFDVLRAAHPKMDELPFDYTRKLASVLVGNGSENLLIVKGNLDAVAARCCCAVYHSKQIALGDDAMESIRSVTAEMLDDGMKVLAVAYKNMGRRTAYSSGDENDLTLLGYLVFFDAPKKSAASALQKLKSLQVDVRVLTGDKKNVALSICRRLGIATGEVLTGAELDLLHKKAGDARIMRTAVFTDLTPQHKQRIVGVLQNAGHTVGFLGDGMNDLPAILKADVGISVDNAAPAVQESADVILLKKDLNILEAGILEGRKAFANMSKYIKITASSNFGNILSIVIASVFLPFLPMTSLQILLLNLLYDISCLALPWDKVDKNIYSHPRSWSGRNLASFMGFFGPISSVFDLVTFGFLFFVLCPALTGGSYGELSGAQQIAFVAAFQTGWFLESLWSQVLIIHMLRTKKIPFIQSWPSWQVLAASIIGLALFTSLCFTELGGWLGLVQLPGGYFIYLTATVIIYMLTVSIAKTYYIYKRGSLI